MIREKLLYVGIDVHKQSHTAVLVNCWNEHLKTITIENKPSEFNKLLQKVQRVAMRLELQPVYGLENAYGHGRALAVWLIEKGCAVKDVNPSLAYDQRKSTPIMEKNDEHDAYSVATVLINQLHKLPDAKPHDAYWTLSQLVNRREKLVKDGVRLKNGLHEQICIAYPSYRQFFYDIDGKTSLYFYKTYPSPIHLRYKSADELEDEFKNLMRRGGTKKGRAALILDCVQNDGDTHRDYQKSRDFITQSLARCLERQKEEIALIESEIERMLKEFDYKLTTLPGVDIVTASKLISEIGDISRFKNADKLARYSGIAPVTFSSAGKGKDISSKQGNRFLNGVFYFMAVTMVAVKPKTKEPYQPIFREYFERKISEGKTPSQALVCIMRRLVSIVYGMMRHKTEYRPFRLDEQEQDS
jgi:transposase